MGVEGLEPLGCVSDVRTLLGISWEGWEGGAGGCGGFGLQTLRSLAGTNWEGSEA